MRDRMDVRDLWFPFTVFTQSEAICMYGVVGSHSITRLTGGMRDFYDCRQKIRENLRTFLMSICD